MPGIRWMFGASLLLMLALPGPGRAAGEDDEHWIEQYMERQAGARPAVASTRVGFGELPGLVGRRVRIWLDDGRERRGLVQDADGERVTLQTVLAGGSFSFSIERPRVRSIELEARR
jgi:hypothetical protein